MSTPNLLKRSLSEMGVGPIARIRQPAETIMSMADLAFATLGTISLLMSSIVFCGISFAAMDLLILSWIPLRSSWIRKAWSPKMA